ncbi:glial cell line-derived neurotrophic factor-like [Pholidichthys leucotaenia]
MKLRDGLTTCLILLSTVRAGPLLPRARQPKTAKRSGRVSQSAPELPPVRIRLSAPPRSENVREAIVGGGKHTIEEPLSTDLEDVVELIKVTISRMRRSSSSAVSSSVSTTTATASTSSSSSSSPTPEETLNSRTRHKRGKKKKGESCSNDNRERGGVESGVSSRKVRGGRDGGRGQGCGLRQIHLNVTDLGLGYRSSEEMIFRYCSGPCRKSETNYDKILYNLIHKKKLPPKDMPPQACCRPTAFDDDLSFLDDSLVYHTIRKHSARKCGCV